MEGKIDAIGNLWIYRKSKLVKMCCPFDATNAHPEYSIGVCCNHCCPLFGEPRNVHYPSSATDTGKEEDFTHLTICHGHSFSFDKFTDERK